MLRAFAILLSCQLAGEMITRALVLPLPGWPSNLRPVHYENINVHYLHDSRPYQS